MTLKNTILFSLFLVITSISFSQSKKEIIAHQTFQIDSLSKVNRLKDDSLKTNKAFIIVNIKSLDQCKSENSTLSDSNTQLKITINKLNNQNSQLLKEKNTLENSLNLIRKNIDSLTIENQNLHASLNAIIYKATCVNEEKINPNSLNPVKTKTCDYNFIRTISKSELDFGGKNHESFELFVKRGNVYQKIKNEELFNESKNELLDQINATLEYNFNKLKIEHEECLKEFPFKAISFEDIGISFSENTMNLHYDFSYSKTCMKSFETNIQLKLSDIEKYLIKN